MGKTNYRGIDYGMGMTNIDRKTGIRFGVIPMDSLNEWAWESFESDYGSPSCPKCGNEIGESAEWENENGKDLSTDTDEDGDPLHSGKRIREYYCPDCRKSYESEDVYGEEPLGWNLEDAEYSASVDSYNDVFIVRSPYFTRAQFCSPCAPGACHLDNPCDDGEKSYCFGHDWFDGDRAPYPVYSVETGKRVWHADSSANVLCPHNAEQEKLCDYADEKSYSIAEDENGEYRIDYKLAPLPFPIRCKTAIEVYRYLGKARIADID